MDIECPDLEGAGSGLTIVVGSRSLLIESHPDGCTFPHFVRPKKSSIVSEKLPIYSCFPKNRRFMADFFKPLYATRVPPTPDF